jgi:predicted ferric reductase
VCPVSAAKGKIRAPGARWATAYLVMAALPLPLALWRHADTGRGFWVELGVALGFVGLAMMGLQFALTARFRWLGRGLGLDDMMQAHRQAGIVAVAFLLAHPLILFAAHRPFLAFLDPRVNAPRALALTAALVALLLLVILPLGRRRLRIPYEWWRLTHAALAALALLIGLAHVLMVGHYVGTPLKQALWIAMTGGALLLLGHARLIRPMAMRQRPWRVAEVRPETERVWTLRLEPEGHAGMRFAPGQFVWLSFAPSPLALDQHPFTIASSAEREDAIELTIKELGDFTARIGELEVGTRAYLEGPFGEFGPEATGAGAAVFVVGGIGVTPALSALRTMCDRGESRRTILVYGSDTLDKVVCREELESLATRLPLDLRFVLDHPPADWEGNRGPISKDLLREIVDTAEADVHYFVCGPEPMMDAVETALYELGAPSSNVHAERFNLV